MNECTQMGWTNMVAILGLLSAGCFVAWLFFRAWISTEPGDPLKYRLPERQPLWSTGPSERSGKANDAGQKAMRKPKA